MSGSKILIVLSFFILFVNACKTLNPQNTPVEAYQELPLDWTYLIEKPTLFFDLIHSSIEITVDLQEKNIFGEATLTLIPYAYPQDILRLDILGLEITAVDATKGVSGVIETFETDENSLYIYFNQSIETKDTINIKIRYNTIPYSSICPDEQFLFFVHADSAEILTAIWTDRSILSNLTWYPTILASNEWSTFELRIDHDKEYQSYTSGKLVATFEEENILSDYWIFNKPIPASNVNFNLSKDTKDVLSVYKEIEESNKIEVQGRNKLLSILNFYDSLFGFDLSDHPINVFLFDTNYFDNLKSGNAFKGRAFSYDNITIQEEWKLGRTLSSRWFSGLINHSSIADLALINSLQSYAGHLWVERAMGSETANHYFHQFIENNWENINSDLSVIDYFDHTAHADLEVSQVKGMFAFHLLRNYLGDQVFFKSIQHLIKSHSFQSVDIHDIKKSFEKICGEDLTWFFQQWFFWPSLPFIESKHTLDGDTLFINIVQDNLINRPYRLTTYLDIHFEDNVIQYPILIEKMEHLFRIPVKSEPKAVVFDPYFNFGISVERNLNRSELNYLLMSNHDDVKLKINVLEEVIENDFFKEINLNQVKQLLDSANDQFAQLLFSALSSGKTSITKTQLIELVIHFQNQPNFQESVAYLQVLMRTGKSLDWKKWLKHENPNIRAFAISQKYSVLNFPDSDQLTVFLSDSAIEVRQTIAKILSEKGVLNFSSWFTAVIISCPSDYLLVFLDHFIVYLNNSKEILSKSQFDYFYQLSEKSNRPEVRLKSIQVLITTQNEQMASNTLDEFSLKECNDQLIEIYQLMKEQLNK
jgi:aminopeptidase N